MFLPSSMGGPELAPLTVFRAIEELSKADGSIGWCAMIATDVSLFMGWLPAGMSVATLAISPPIFAPLVPCGRWAGPIPLNGGYCVPGHSNFASGIDYANWLYCLCTTMYGERAVLTAAGRRDPGYVADLGQGED